VTVRADGILFFWGVSIVKNFIKLFVAVLGLTVLLVACDKKGGIIEVTNGTQDVAWVNIIEGANIADAFKEGEGTQLSAGQMQKFTFDEDGIYTVFATIVHTNLVDGLAGSDIISKFNKTVTLLAGSTEKVTIVKQ